MSEKSSRIDYHIEKHQITGSADTPRLTRQWQQVIDTCHQQRADSAIRLRLALETVDYITSFELPFRLLLTRAPQLIDKLRKEVNIFSRPAKINDNKRGVVYSRHDDFSRIPYEFNYERSYHITRSGALGGTTSSYTAITKIAELPRERLRLALTSGLQVTALDALLFFDIQRVAANVERLRKQGLNIALSHVTAFDSQTQTVREIPAYRCA
ncbi:hypothetical protein D3C79_312590 [compost metagenome]